MLGADADSVIATRLGRTKVSVVLTRRKKGISVLSDVRDYWTPEEIAMLGTMSDVEAAHSQRATSRPGLAAGGRCGSGHGPGHGNRRAIKSNSRGGDQSARSIKGVPIFRSIGVVAGSAWTPEDESLLGTMPDAELAQKLKRTKVAVGNRRTILRIRPYCATADG